MDLIGCLIISRNIQRPGILARIVWRERALSIWNLRSVLGGHIVGLGVGDSSRFPEEKDIKMMIEDDAFLVDGSICCQNCVRS